MTSYNWESYEPKRKKKTENRSVGDEVDKLKKICIVWNVKWYIH